MRGEQADGTPQKRGLSGSSPHARGADQLQYQMAVPFGIIPACAGSRKPSLPAAARNRDHPRMRGEQGRYRRGNGKRAGSSPHARGAVAVPVEWPIVGRIIPACAGSSFARRRVPGWDWDHPRMRGEQTKKILIAGGSLLHGLPNFNEFLIELFRGQTIVFRTMCIACMDSEMRQKRRQLVVRYIFH